MLGSNAKLINQSMAGEVIAESDRDVCSFKASYDTAENAHPAMFLLEIGSALKPCGRVALRALI